MDLAPVDVFIAIYNGYCGSYLARKFETEHTYEIFHHVMTCLKLTVLEKAWKKVKDVRDHSTMNT